MDQLPPVHAQTFASSLTLTCTQTGIKLATEVCALNGFKSATLQLLDDAPSNQTHRPGISLIVSRDKGPGVWEKHQGTQKSIQLHKGAFS